MASSMQRPSIGQGQMQEEAGMVKMSPPVLTSVLTPSITQSHTDIPREAGGQGFKPACKQPGRVAAALDVGPRGCAGEGKESFMLWGRALSAVKGRISRLYAPWLTLSLVPSRTSLPSLGKR